MLGHTLLFELQNKGFEVFGTVRKKKNISKLLPLECNQRVIDGVDAINIETIKNCIKEVKPDVVINCIGIIKQLPEGKMALPCIEMNARLPHKLYEFCNEYNCRLIHYSTDCVFDGKKETAYLETDPCTATDYYGITKYLGEVYYKNALTVRTSIIGNELKNRLSLIEWFLNQNGQVNGYANVIYSGLPCSEHANILTEYILPDKKLEGLYQVSSTPISKYELLKLVAAAYDKNIEIVKCDQPREKKILSGEKFSKVTGYRPPDWTKLVDDMHTSYMNFNNALSGK